MHIHHAVYTYINRCTYTSTKRFTEYAAAQPGFGGWPWWLAPISSRGKNHPTFVLKGKTMGNHWETIGKPLGNHGFENQSFELFASVNFFHIVWPVFTIAFGKRSDQYRAGSVMDTVFCWVFCGPNHHVSPTQHLELLHQKRTKLFCKRTEWTCPFAGVFFNLFFN